MKKLLLLINISFMLIEISHSQLGSGLGTIRANRLANEFESKFGSNSYSSTNGVDYGTKYGETSYIGGAQPKIIITKEIIESPTGTITKITTTQQEPSYTSFGRKKREIETPMVIV